jgi:hypothetical protein
MKPRFTSNLGALHILCPFLIFSLVGCHTPEPHHARATAATAPQPTQPRPVRLAPRSTYFMTAFGSMDDSYGGVTASPETIESVGKQAM